MLRDIMILCALATLAWGVGIKGLVADLVGLAVLVVVATFVKSAIGGHPDRSGRELYERNLRKGPDG